MKHRDYVTEREACDPEFRKVREASRPRFEFRVAMVRARLAAGLTQVEVAEAMGVSSDTVDRLECGLSSPTLETMMRLAKALSVSFEITPNATVEVHEAETST